MDHATTSYLSTDRAGAGIGAACLCALLLMMATAHAAEPERVELWPDGAPGAKGEGEADTPTLDIYLPGWKPAGTAVIVCPGGGYGHLAMEHEGEEVAEWFNARGVAAFVLRYRIAPRYQHPAPLQDAERAIRYVRSHAEKFKVDPDRIGIMGFSAGGHLASTAATHFDEGDPDADDPVERVSSRPDFAVLCYPVIAMSTEYGHTGSKRNLLGEDPDPALVEEMSTEKQVTDRTPPTFLFHTNEDQGVPAENSVLFYLALREHDVPAELHIFAEGHHGVGLAPGDPLLSVWPRLLAQWMAGRGLLDRGE